MVAGFARTRPYRGTEQGCYLDFQRLLVKFFRGCKKEKVRSDDQKKEDIDSAGKVEHDNAEKRRCRRHTVVTEK